MKRPAGLGASRKRAAEEHTKPNSKKARTSPSNEAVDETGVLMESTGEGPVGDLLALYEKFEKAEHSLDAANWLRGVIHESDRLLRNSEELKVDNEGGEKTMVKGLYGASLLRMGLLGADVRKPDEPQSLMDWLEVALEQLPAEFTLKGDYADWDTRFMWDRAVALWLFEGDQDDTSVTATQALTFSHSMLLSPSTTPIDHYLGFAGLLLPESDALSVLRLAQLAEFMDAASQNFEKHVKDMDEQRKSDLKAVQAEVNLILGSKVVAMLEPEDDETEEDVDESCKSESPKLLGTGKLFFALSRPWAHN